MTIAITHPFVSAKGDGTDATLVRPSNWNAAHATSIATGKFVGRLTAGAGAFEELAITSFAAAALAAADANSFLAALGIGAFETGDVKFSIHTTAPTGWIVYDGQGTIGDASSGATVRANADCLPLYTIIYNYIPDSHCPVTGGRTTTLADFNAHKPIALPRFSGRAIVGAGTGSGINTRATGQYFGAENAALGTSNLPPYTPSGTVAVTGGITHNAITGGPSGASAQNAVNGSVTLFAFSNATINNPTYGFTGNPQGGTSVPFSILNPSIPLWVKVKL